MRASIFLLGGIALACPSVALAQSAAAFPDIPSQGRPAPAAAPTPAARPTAEGPTADAPTRERFQPREPMSPTPASFALSASSPAAPAFAAPTQGAFAPLRFGPSPTSPTADSGFEVKQGPATTPLVIGGVALGLPYATGLGIAASESFDNGSGWLAAPVAGPWLALSGRRDPCENAGAERKLDSEVGKCVAEPLVRGMLVLDGVLQATGAVLLIVGASSSETRIVRREAQLVAAPAPVGRTGYGMAMAGQF
jgi:hypothetical protein